MDFPQYRKYKNIETYFKIISEKKFEEISSLGGKYMQYKVIATKYPEMLRIQDMLSCKDQVWEIIEENEYLKIC